MVGVELRAALPQAASRGPPSIAAAAELQKIAAQHKHQVQGC